MADTTKAELERQKLQAEIRKLTAEAETAELDARLGHNRERLDNADSWRNRIYNFVGEVGTHSTEDCIENISRWARCDPGCDITIVLNSPGGSVIDGLALYDAIADLKRKGHKFTTVARGMAASMGGILLQAGDDRIVSANAHVLIHEMSSGAFGKMSEMADRQEYWNKLQTKLLNILAERSTMSAAQIKRKWERKDWWLDAAECVELGFADRIG